MQHRFGSAAYAMEELRTELASAFVAAELGIPADIPHHASYIAEWIKPLKEDKCEIFRAAADAQRIAACSLAFIRPMPRTSRIRRPLPRLPTPDMGAV
jgi:antirestriction protein ArdC